MKTILSLALLCTSLTSFAGAFGTPDQDPVVKYARDLFDDGQSPSFNFLLNNKFECTNLSAVKNNFKKEKMSDEIAFTRSGPFLAVQGNEDVVFTDNSDEFVTAINNESEDDAVNYVALRFNDETQTLVMERSIILSDKAEAGKYVESLAYANTNEEEKTVVVEYSVCHRI